MPSVLSNYSLDAEHKSITESMQYRNMIPKSDFEKQLSFIIQTEKKTLTDHWLQHKLKKAYEVREERNITETQDAPRSKLLRVRV